MLTIGQLARYVGVSTKTIRVYHNKRLLAEPDRDSSGYRRYTARHAIDLVKIRTLAGAGIPLARIRHLQTAPRDQLQHAIGEVDAELAARIQRLQDTRQRLRRLATGRLHPLPDEVAEHLDHLSDLGFTPGWVALETDLWILVFATYPDTAVGLFHDQVQALTDPMLRQIYLDYDQAHDLNPHDPRIDELARRIVTATRSRYDPADLPGQHTGSDLPALIQTAVNASSPAWNRLDTLIRAQLAA